MSLYTERSRTVVHVVQFDIEEIAQVAKIEVSRMPVKPNVRWVDGVGVEVSWPEDLMNPIEPLKPKGKRKSK